MLPSFLLYIIAVIITLILYFFYEDQSEDELENKPRPSTNENDSENNSSTAAVTSSAWKPKIDFRLNSIFVALGLKAPPTCQSSEEQFDAFTEHFKNFEEVSEACWRAGLESSSLLIGVDFTASNEWKGRKSFNQNCLHKLVGSKITNPYQKVISILGQTLAPFDDDNRIPAYGFGDTLTKDKGVFSLKPDGSPCAGFQEVLEWYNDAVKRVSLSGPSSLAPIIDKAIELVQQTGPTLKYHILVIITDGQVTQASSDSIIRASSFPLSIIAVGVGDGPWNILERFDTQLPRRKFDNFRFVDYHRVTAKSKSPDMAFALHALMEVPDQYKRIRELGYLGVGASRVEQKAHRLSECVGVGGGTVFSPKRSFGGGVTGGSPGRTFMPSMFRHRVSNLSC